MQTSCPGPATARPAIIIESMKFAPPPSGIEHLSTPVSTTTVRPSFVTLSEPVAWDAPLDKFTVSGQARGHNGGEAAPFE